MSTIRYRPTTPKKVSKRIKKFIKEIGLNEDPMYLKHTQLSNDNRPRYCLNNCEAENKKNNTPIIYGWAIWEDKKQRFIEAEFHAVIKHRGKPCDITPRADGEERVLFIPDSNRTPKHIDSKTWETWTNHKSLNGKIIEVARPIQLVDAALIERQ